MRIIAGSKKGHPLFAPKGFLTRPTADRVREAVFNILGALPPETRVLDLFAGTGALGLEALSRGVSEAVFVEENPKACFALKRNVVSLGWEKQTQLYAESVEMALAHLNGPFHLVFVDPPYQSPETEKALIQLSFIGERLLSPFALVVVEHLKKPPRGQSALQDQYGSCLSRVDLRTYGQTGISFYEYRPLSSFT